MKILVIIVTYNGMKWIDKCLDSTRHSSIPLDVMVIDNGSSDGTIEYIQKEYKEVILIPSNENLGFGRANNIGLQYVLDNHYDYAYLLNQDAWIFNDTIERLVSANLNHPEYGILSPMMLERDGQSLEPNFESVIKSCNYKCYNDYCKNSYTNEIYDVGSVMAAHWLINRQTILIVGGFSPIFPHRGEDTNYIDRVHYYKIKIGVVISARSVHDMHIDNPRERRVYSAHVMNLVRLSSICNVQKYRLIKAIVSSLKWSVVYIDIYPIREIVKTIASYGIIKKYRDASKDKCAFLNSN